MSVGAWLSLLMVNLAPAAESSVNIDGSPNLTPPSTVQKSSRSFIEVAVVKSYEASPPKGMFGGQASQVYVSTWDKTEAGMRLSSNIPFSWRSQPIPAV